MAHSGKVLGKTAILAVIALAILGASVKVADLNTATTKINKAKAAQKVKQAYTAAKEAKAAAEAKAVAEAMAAAEATIAELVAADSTVEEAKVEGHAVVYDDEKLLACERGKPWEPSENKGRFIIQAKDEPFAQYDNLWRNWLFPEKENNTVICRSFAPPTELASVIGNLPIPDDVIGVIAANVNTRGVHCQSCELNNFNMSLLEKCTTDLASNPASSRVAYPAGPYGSQLPCTPRSEGGRGPGGIFIRSHPLQTCLTSANANQVAVCHMRRHV